MKYFRNPTTQKYIIAIFEIITNGFSKGKKPAESRQFQMIQPNICIAYVSLVS